MSRRHLKHSKSFKYVLNLFSGISYAFAICLRTGGRLAYTARGPRSGTRRRRDWTRRTPRRRRLQSFDFMRFSIYAHSYTYLSQTAVDERVRPDLGRVVLSSHHIGGLQSPESSAQQASNFKLLKLCMFLRTAKPHRFCFQCNRP